MEQETGIRSLYDEFFRDYEGGIQAVSPRFPLELDV
jgi:hypothetical protein